MPVPRESYDIASSNAAAVQAEHYRDKAVGLYEDRLSVSASISDAGQALKQGSSCMVWAFPTLAS